MLYSDRSFCVNCCFPVYVNSLFFYAFPDSLEAVMVVFGNVSAANLPYQNGFLEAFSSELMGHSSFRIPISSQALKTRTRRRTAGPLQVSL